MPLVALDLLAKRKWTKECLLVAPQERFMAHPTNACFVSWMPRIFSLKNS